MTWFCDWKEYLQISGYAFLVSSNFAMLFLSVIQLFPDDWVRKDVFAMLFSTASTLIIIGGATLIFVALRSKKEGC